MTPLALGLTLLSSLCWSVFDLARKRLSTRLSPSTAVIALMLGQLPLFALMSASDPWFVPGREFWLPALVSIALNIFANVLFLRSVQLAPLSLAVPMLSFTPVFGAAMGFILLGERLAPRQLCGIALVILGALALQGVFKKKGADGHLTPDVRKGIWLMITVAFLWSVTPVIDKIGLRSSAVSFYAFFQCLGIAFALLALKARTGLNTEVRALRAGWKDLLLAVIVATGALTTQFLAIREIQIGLFEALKRAVGLNCALLLGAWMFREPITREKLAAVVLMILGIALILI